MEWSIYVSLINAYSALGMNLLLFQISFNVCGVGLAIPIVLLSHFALKTARRLKNAGIPLDFQLEIPID